MLDAKILRTVLYVFEVMFYFRHPRRRLFLRIIDSTNTLLKCVKHFYLLILLSFYVQKNDANTVSWKTDVAMLLMTFSWRITRNTQIENI